MRSSALLLLLLVPVPPAAAQERLRLPRQLVVHRHLGSVDLPRDGDGRPAALRYVADLGRPAVLAATSRAVGADEASTGAVLQAARSVVARRAAALGHVDSLRAGLGSGVPMVILPEVATRTVALSYGPRPVASTALAMPRPM